MAKGRTADFDLVLLGATGFTGRLVAEYLARRKPGVRWALAGRNRAKLEAVRAGLASIDPALALLPLLETDSTDPAQAAALAARTKVVCTTVGPYARYGSALVAACAAAGTDCCDLTGEPHWVRAMIDAHHAQAEKSGARIVTCCGYDSLPSDLGVLLLHREAQALGETLGPVHGRVVRLKGGFSGGTVASILDILEAARDRNVRRVLGNPHTLDGGERPRGPDRSDLARPARDPETGGWLAPFVMASINTRIVRRSNALQGGAYGPGFRYDECMEFRPGRKGLTRAVAISAGLGGMVALGATRTGQRLARRFLPGPGEGPTAEQRERGSFRHEYRTTLPSGRRRVAVVEGHRDPGYGETALMLGEAALCLAQDDLPARGGLLTPAVAMGMSLVERLRTAGMVWQVEG